MHKHEDISVVIEIKQNYILKYLITLYINDISTFYS